MSLALTNTGSAPGIVNVVVRETTERLDSCDSIEMNVYEGVWSKKFIPFWWSPEVAFDDMGEVPTRFVDGKFVDTEPFANPVMIKFKGVDKEIRMVDHSSRGTDHLGDQCRPLPQGCQEYSFQIRRPPC